jgi:hypothetical protein
MNLEKCLVCGSKHLDNFCRQYGGDINSNGRLSGIADGPDEARCEECDAEYVEGELVTEYYLAKWMPKSVRRHIDQKKAIADLESGKLNI